MTTGRDRTPPPLHRRPAALLTVFVGGGVGTLARYGGEQWLGGSSGTWPWATIAINVTGAFVLGLLLESLMQSGPDEGMRRSVRLLFGTGFCGAFTTYSTFALEASELIRAGRPTLAAAYAVTVVVAGTLAALGGIVLGAARRGREL